MIFFSILQQFLKERDTFRCKKCRFVENEGSGFVEGERMVLNEKDSFEAVEKFYF